MRRFLRRALPCLLIPLAGAVRAEDERPVAGHEKAHVSLSMLRTVRGGATNRTMVMSPNGLAPGEKLEPTVFAAGGGPQGCLERMTLERPETVLGSYPLVWTVSVEVRSVATNAIVLGVEWERLTQRGEGPTRLAGVSMPEEITLREGERALLDFADRSPSGEFLCAQNFAIELTAAVEEDPVLARRQIEYDLWLVHDGPGGGQGKRHLELTATQGEESKFQFPHQRLPVSAGTKVEGAETELQVDVQGTLRGRLRPDGAIDLSLGATRYLWYVAPDGKGEHVGDGGQKVLHVKPQEIIRVDLPGATRNTEQPERYARDLAGHSFALVLRARALESK